LPSSGLFVTLYDEDTLNLYLDRGIYGFLMPPVFGNISSRSRHYAALADYACTRRGTHVFFFLKRMIAYGGQITGSKSFGAFYLNGPYSPMGRKANAKVYWDESKRERYVSTDRPGIFNVPEVGQRCQPYLIIFKDELNLKGRIISSDQLYFELGKYSYPLPSNSISGMGFCTLTPGETDIALSLLEKESVECLPGVSSEKVNIEGSPIPFDPKYGILSLKEAFGRSLLVNEAHLEASVLANPDLLPKEVRPNGATICRQVPVSPFKPFQMGRADICYFKEDCIANGTVPNVVIELKSTQAGKNAIEQITRYLKWFHIVLGEEASKISVYLLAPSFAVTDKLLPEEYRYQVKFIGLGNDGHLQKKNCEYLDSALTDDTACLK